MGLEAETTTEVASEAAMETGDRDYIPGLDLDGSDANADRKDKKVPYSKPIPRNFQAQWNDTGKPDEGGDASREIKDVITQMEGNTDRSSLPTAMMVSGRRITILRMSLAVHCCASTHSTYPKLLPANSPLEAAVMDGMDAVNNLINSGGVTELADIVAQTDLKRLRVEHKIHLIFEESPMDVDMQKQQHQQQQQQQLDHHHHRGMHRDNNHGHHPQWNHQQPPPQMGGGPWNRGPPPHGPPPRRPGNNHNNNGDRNRGGGGGRWHNNRRN